MNINNNNHSYENVNLNDFDQAMNKNNQENKKGFLKNVLEITKYISETISKYKNFEKGVQTEQTKENKFNKIGHKENYQVLRLDKYKFQFYFCMAFNCCIRLLMICLQIFS